ncbi:hypothetical protein DdX_03505 [Ditylenchus destructor]|uniref:Uncharacterized protein n=1 Tax=Ditylenchus destructor TaxID=166010 RepID=A0AAD4NCL6_9BILA|nr:hypothetical protein DdX_03505 [Ditylenchus destructor]
MSETTMIYAQNEDCNVPTICCLIAIVVSASVAQLFTTSHLLSHWVSRIGIFRTLTTLTLSVCAWIIVAAQSTILVLHTILHPHSFYYLMTTIPYRIFLVLDQLATLYLFLFICLSSIARVMCPVMVASMSRTWKATSIFSLSTSCLGTIILLSMLNCYDRFYQLSLSFGMECVSTSINPENSVVFAAIFFQFVQPFGFGFSLLMVTCKKLCSVNLRTDLRESVAISTVSANDYEPRREKPNRGRVYAQTKLCVVLMLLFLDSIARLILFINDPGEQKVLNPVENSADDGMHAHSQGLPYHCADLGAVILNCVHFMLIGVGIPLCHYLANPRLRHGFEKILHFIATLPRKCYSIFRSGERR